MSDPLSKPLVSVVIPAYNQAEYVSDAITSALTQSYTFVEVIVVDDASTDGTATLLKRFSDSRLKIVYHSRNLGLSAARNSGIRASHGDVVAFLDADDYYHPEKIARHVAFLRAHPEIGVTYNARFELNHSARTVRELWRPPGTCGLRELVCGFPFAPSDMVIRRDWIRRVGMFDEHLLYYSEDLDINCRLALDGCRFACVDRPLNYRRYHSGRIIQVNERLAAALNVVDRVCTDPQCPAEVVATWKEARASHLVVWAFCAFLQEVTALGRECLDTAVKLDPSFLDHGAHKLKEFLIQQSMSDENFDHIAVLRLVRAQFSPKFKQATEGLEIAAKAGYVSRAIRAAMWNREDDARRLFAFALGARARVNAPMRGTIATHLLNVGELMGVTFADSAIDRIYDLAPAAYSGTIRQIKACYFLNRSMGDFRAAAYRDVMSGARNAVMNNLPYALNRGLLSVSVRSAWHIVRSMSGGARANAK